MTNPRPPNPPEPRAPQPPWQELYQALFESASDGVFIADGTGQLVDANPRFCEWAGYSHSELLRLSCLDLFPGHDLLDHARPRPGLKPGPVKTTLRQRCGSEYRLMEAPVSIHALSDGGWLGLVENAPVPPAGMQALLAKEACVDNAPIAIFRHSPDGRVLEVNDQACQDLGYSREELLGLTVFDFDPTLTPDLWREHRRRVATEGVRTVETTHRRKDGSTRSVEVTVNHLQFQGHDYTYSFVKDITERKKAEAALKESEQRFRQQAEAAFEGIAVTWQGEFLEVNDQFARMVGYSREELLHTPVSRCVAPEHRDLVAAFMRSGRLEPYEHLALRKDGTMFNVEIRARTARLGDQEVRITAIRDITERKRLERETDERRQFLESILASTPDAVAIADRQHCILEWNPGAEKLFGYTAAEARGQRIDDLITGDNAAVRDEAVSWTRKVEGARGTSSAEGVRYRKDGSPVTVSISVGPLLDRNEWAGEVAVYTDITERKQTEKALQESNDILQALIHAAPLAIIAMDPAGIVTQWNPAAEQMLGWSEPEAVGRFLPYVPADKLDESHALRARILKGETLTGVEVRRQKKDGSPVDLSISIAPLHDAQGRVSGIISVNADITERKKIEAALRESEFVLRKSQAIAQIGSYYFDAQTGHWIGSLALDELFGIDGGFVKDTQGWGSLIHPDDRDRMLNYLSRDVLAGRHRFDREYRIVRRDNGQERWVHGIGELEFDEEGRAVAMIGTIQDITERKEAELGLRLSEAKFRTTFENSLAGEALVGLDGRYLMVNPAFSEIFGYSVEEFLSSTFFGITHPDDLELSRRVNQEVLAAQGRPIRYTKRYLHKDGRTIWAEVSSAVVFGLDGSASYFITHVNDVTDKKLAEDALRAARDQLVNITDNIPMLIGQISRERRYEYINATYARFFGRPKADVVGRLVSEVLPEKDYVLGCPYMERVLSGEAVAYENTLRNAEGELRAVWVHYTPHRDEAGQVIGYFSLVQDITERKQAEMLIQAQKEQLVAQNEELTAQNEELVSQGRALEAAEASLREMNEDLEQRIRARSAELHAANAELQLANAALVRAGRMKDEFLANMSHELRTPLNAILGFAELLEKGLYGDLTDKQRHPLQMMQVSAQHLLQLINDILDLSKVEAGKMELELGPVLVDEVCQSALQFVQQTAHKKNIQLSQRLDPEVRQVLADGRRLKQMLINLLNNAVKFTPEGGQVGLDVASGPGGGQAPEHVRFTVWDTGIGIPLEKQAQLFQPFVQLDGSLSRKYEGTGLGLALVHAMADLHGGSVSMESGGLGKGARFTITLPWTPGSLPRLSAEASETASGFVSLAAMLGRPPLIMAVDDNAMTLNVLTSFLEAMGCTVMSARDGGEALAALTGETQTARPDLILLDIQLPGVDGLTVIRRVRAAGMAVPIVALTALAMPGDRERCLEAGADDYLSKPVRLDAVARVIQHQLSSKE